RRGRASRAQEQRTVAAGRDLAGAFRLRRRTVMGTPPGRPATAVAVRVIFSACILPRLCEKRQSACTRDPMLEPGLHWLPVWAGGSSAPEAVRRQCLLPVAGLTA